MKIPKILTRMFTIFAITGLVACGGQPSAEKAGIDPENVVEQVFLTTLHCDGCVNTIQTKMPDNDGIVSATADLATKLVKVSYDPSLISGEGIIEAFGELGYEASLSSEAYPEDGSAQADTTGNGSLEMDIQ